MEFTGIVIEVVDKSGVSKKDGSPFKSFQVVVKEDAEQYPQTGVFETFGDKIAIPSVGDKVEVHFNMKASEYNGKWYPRDSAWKINTLESVSTATEQAVEESQSDALPF